MPEKERVESAPGRAGFSPFIDGLDVLIQGGVPLGSWVSLYGPPGSYKTLHALAFCLAGLLKGEPCVYVSTEMNSEQLLDQLRSLGWYDRLKNVHYVNFTNNIIERSDYGRYQFVIIDLDSLYWWSKKLNAIAYDETEKKKGAPRRWYWYDNPNLLTHIIIVGLGAVGVTERKYADIQLDEVEKARLREGLLRDSKYAMFHVNTDVTARVVIDSVSPYVTGRYSLAGRILTQLKLRLELPNVTYLFTSHEGSTNERELGVEIGHVTDGRIRLWTELEAVPETGNKESRTYGWIAKMRATDHSRRVHNVVLERGKETVLRWVAQQGTQKA